MVFSLDQIQQDFRWVTLPSLREVLQRYGYHYFPAYNHLLKDMTLDGQGRPKSTSGLKLLTKERVAREVELYDALFVTEYEFTHREEVQKREEEAKQREQLLRAEEDERTGNVFECGCCFVDVPLSRMVQCAEGHLFCTDCIKKYVEEAVYASGQTTVHCLDQSGCKANFPMDQLERAVPAHQLQKIFARLADLDIKKAGLENIHQCPHCDFQMEISNPDEKLFVCRNPECGMETCLLCKEPNHIPLRCEEVEKKDVTDYRKKVEEAMTESLVRTCPKCKAKFFKTEGCNKMTCSCGAYVCYVCRKQISHKNGYSHFCSHDRNPREFGKCAECGKCFLFLKSTESADQELVEQAKVAATEQFAGGNVELAAVKVGAAQVGGKKKKQYHHQHQAYANVNAQRQPGMRFGDLVAQEHHRQAQQIQAFHALQVQNIVMQAMQRLRQGMGVIGGLVGFPPQNPMPRVAGLAVNHRGEVLAPDGGVGGGAGAEATAAAAVVAHPAGPPNRNGHLNNNAAMARGVARVQEVLPEAPARPKRRYTGEPIVVEDDDVIPIEPPYPGVGNRGGGVVAQNPIAVGGRYHPHDNEDEEDEEYADDSDHVEHAHYVDYYRNHEIEDEDDYDEDEDD